MGVGGFKVVKSKFLYFFETACNFIVLVPFSFLFERLIKIHVLNV